MKNIRQLPGTAVQDQGLIDNVEHNPAAGARKVAEVGGHLLPLAYNSAGTITYTTDATTVRALDSLGKCLQIYNNSAGVLSVTLGEDSAISSLAAGVTDASGHVGIPCAPNAWTKIACGTQNWVIASSNLLKVFVVDDATSIKQEVATYKGN